MVANSAAQWSFLFYLYLSIALLVGALVIGWLTYNMIKFRHRPGDPRPPDAPHAGVVQAERGHPIWGYVMAAVIAAIMFGLAFGTISAIGEIETLPTDDPNAVVVDVTGYQFGWKYVYEGEGGVPVTVITPATEVDKEFHVPVGRPVILYITSQDVWHNFAIPDFRLRVDAIPGVVNHLWFNAEEPGVYKNACVVICGTGHAHMHTDMHVVTNEEFEAWLQAKVDAEYDELLGDALAARPTAAWRNVTLQAEGPALENTTFLPGRPLVLAVENAGATAQAVAVLGPDGATLREITVEPGATSRLYVEAPETGTLTLVAGETRISLEASA